MEWGRISSLAQAIYSKCKLVQTGQQLFTTEIENLPRKIALQKREVSSNKPAVIYSEVHKKVWTWKSLLTPTSSVHNIWEWEDDKLDQRKAMLNSRIYNGS